MCSGAGARMGKSRRLAPTVHDWLYNAITDIATSLNMSVSDFVYICWCIGINTSLPEGTLTEYVGRDITEILAKFQRELEEYAYQVKTTVGRMHENGYLTT